MTTPGADTRVLLVEDNLADADLIREQLLEATSDGSYAITHVARLDDAERHLAAAPADVVLLDLSLPDSQGLQGVNSIVRARRPVPVIVLTGLDDESVALEAIQAQAQDYLVKGQLDGAGLRRTIQHARERHRMQLELEKLALERESLRARQLEAKSQMLSHVSHELRTPLSAIRQFASLLRDGLAGPLLDEQKDYLEVVLKNVLQLGRMIDDLMSVARAEMGKLVVEPRRVDLAEVAQQALRTVTPHAAASGVTLVASVPSSLPPACADPDRLLQVLLNLLDNAIKFTPSGGRVTLQATVATGEPGSLVVTVEDTGCGLSEEARDKIFERHHQEAQPLESSRKGLGLGLYLCKEIVTQHGGRIWADSVPGEGTALRFTVPQFSVARLIAPSIEIDDHVSRGVVLLTVELEWDATPAPLPSAVVEAYREAAVLARRCVLPDLDVVLPRRDPRRQGEPLFVVACTDRVGADVVAGRISGHLHRSPLLRKARVRPDVAVTPVYPSGNMPDSASTVEAIANRISELIDSRLEKWTTDAEAQDPHH